MCPLLYIHSSSSHLAPTTFNINATIAWRRLAKVWNAEDKTEDGEEEASAAAIHEWIAFARAYVCVFQESGWHALLLSPSLSHSICVYAKSMDPTGRSLSAN